jgi:peptidoglycan/LPS O-acetylase OafA/YrhL
MDPRIDRLRGLLAFGVMFGHSIDLAIAGHNSGMNFAFAVGIRPYCGFVCVIGFIVLSGYCIARSTMARFSVGDYAVRRITRLYPLLLMVAVPAGVLEYALFNNPLRPTMWKQNLDPTSYAYAALGLSGFNVPFGALSPAYTISFELMYYAVWGLSLAVTLGRHRLGWCVAGAASIALLVYGDSLRLMLGTHAGFAPPLGIALLPAWLFGAALALFQPHMSRVLRWIPPWIMWFVTACAFGYGVDTYEKPRLIPIDRADVIYYILFSALLVVTLAVWLSRDANEHPHDTWLGELSYPLFLAHGPVIIAGMTAINALGLTLPFELKVLILVGLAVGAAALLTLYVERPLMAWRRRRRTRALSGASAWSQKSASSSAATS